MCLIYPKVLRFQIVMLECTIENGAGAGKINMLLLMVLIILFIYLVQCNINIDYANAKILDTIPCHTEADLPSIQNKDVLLIESVVDDYLKKQNMKKSRCSDIGTSVMSDVIRGAVSGAIMGSTTDSVVSGMVVFGVVSGVFNSYKLAFTPRGDTHR